MLEKDSLDFEKFLWRLRPISNLKFLSKTIEKAVAWQLIDYLQTNGVEELFQSVTNYIVVRRQPLSKCKTIFSVLLINKRSPNQLLDLSATFDTVDHDLLLSRLQRRFGIPGNTIQYNTLFNRVAN